MEKNKLIELVNSAQQGDSSAMDSLFSEFYNDVYYFALKTVKDSDVACDITQETFLEIFRTIDKLNEPVAFVTWMKKITYHQCTRYFKKKKDILVEEDEDGNSLFDTLEDENEGSVPHDLYEKDEFRQTIMSIVDELSEEQRSAVMLYYFDELSISKIAEIQNVSEGTVKSRLNYARKAIKKSVEAYEEKHGVKLHAIPFLPLFLLGFGEKSSMPISKVGHISNKLAKAKATSGFTSASNAVKATATTVKTSAKIASLPLVTKMIIIVVSVLAVGGIVLGVTIANSQPAMKPVASPKYPLTYPEYTTEPTTEPTEPKLEEVDYELKKDAIDGGYKHLVALKADGTVVATGNNDYGQCDVSDWKDIVAVDAGNNHTVGLTKYGTVVATGNNNKNQCDVSEWTNIKAIVAGSDYTIGLKADGSVVVAYSYVHGDGSYSSFVCEAKEWIDIVDISGSSELVVGVKSDGTVVWAGNDFNNGVNSISFEDWRNIVDVDVCNCHCVALRSDGTVISDGVQYYAPIISVLDQLNGIVKIYASDFLKVGLKADGTVMTEDVTPYEYEYEDEPYYHHGYKAAQEMAGWTDIVDVYSGTGYVVAIKKDGSVLAFRDDDYLIEEVIYDSIVEEALQWTGLMTTVTTSSVDFSSVSPSSVDFSSEIEN